MQILPRLLLTPTEHGWTSDKSGRIVRRRMARFLDGEWRALWDESSRYAESSRSNPFAAELADAMRTAPVCDDADDLRRDAAIGKVRRGRIGQGAQRLVSRGGVAPEDARAEVLEHMEQLQLPSHRDDHPCALTAEEEEAFRSYRPRATDLFTGDTVKEVMSQADAGVAGGCSGWRNEHFKGAAETDLGLAALTTIMLAMAQGDCGSPYSENGNMHVWDASRLIALVKGDEWTGAENTRPIAIGETLRRLTGKCLLRARREVMERRALTIHNFAFTSDGCSNVVKLVQLYAHEYPEHVVLTTDVETAFQSAPRTQMERALYEDEGLRPLLPYFYSLYADEAALYFGDTWATKGRQGR